ncbi:MAG: BrnT family toxin [Hyphomonadaceae bacterium]
MPKPPPGFEWDDRKAALNLRKHGVSFALAQHFDFETALEARDPESDEHGEERFLAIGKIEGRFHALVYTLRGENIRIISLRKAIAYEKRRWRQGE